MDIDFVVVVVVRREWIERGRKRDGIVEGRGWIFERRGCLSLLAWVEGVLLFVVRRGCWTWYSGQGSLETLFAEKVVAEFEYMDYL